MSFLSIRLHNATDIIEKREKIALVINYSFETFFVFLLDQTYLHINRITRQILRQDKLPFLPKEVLQSNVKGRIVLLGCNNQNRFYCGCILVEEDYVTQIRELSNVKPELTTKYHLFEPKKDKVFTFYLIAILKNVENGISVSVFDFYKNKWGEQMLYLGSKFLQYLFLDCSKNDEHYREANDIDCHNFALISQGQKYDSINYSKIKIFTENQGQKTLLKLKFIITRDIKLKQQHFVIIGCQQIQNRKIILIGNSKLQPNNQNNFQNSSAYLIIDTHSVQNDEPLDVKVIHISFSLNQELATPTMLRSFIGIVEGSILAVARITDKKWGVVRINQKISEILISFDSPKPPKIIQSTWHDSLYNYQQKCEFIFQKLKGAPAIIEFNLFKLEKKSLQYQRLIKYAFPSLGQGFTDVILNLL